MDITGSSAGEAGPSQPFFKPNTTIDFLFVNETGDSSAYRVGARHDIRSHIRKHCARHFKQKHKIGQKKVAKGQKWIPLASQDPGHSTSEFSLHDEGCPSTLLERPWLASFDVDPLAHSNGVPYRDHSTISDHPEAIGQPVALKSFPELRDTDDSESNEPNTERDLGSYCKTCRAQLHSPIGLTKQAQANDGRMIMTRRVWRTPLELSPVEILGAGRVDPFLTYPVEKPDRSLHELMDLVINHMVPGLIPDDIPHHGTNPVNSVAKAWASAGLRTPLLFHALVYAGSLHLDFLRWSKIYPNSPLALSHKLEAIQKIREVISSGNEAARDEVILAILIIASNEVINVTEEEKKPFNSPLTKVQWLNIYGNIRPDLDHLKAVSALICLKGGIESLNLHGLAEIITIGDILTAVNSTRKPLLPPLSIHESYIASLKMWATSPLRIHSPVLASAFWRLSEYGITDAMLQVLDSMGHITMAIDYHIQGTPGGLTLGKIVKTRTAIQKRVMLLPPAEELNITTLSTPNTYECCRLTAIIFSVAVILPIPNTYDVLQTLVRRLKAAIEVSGTESYGAECSEVLLWILILGGIAALDKPERSWFVSQLALLVERLKIDWAAAERILETFLWLEIACSSSGRRLWSEVLNLAL